MEEKTINQANTFSAGWDLALETVHKWGDGFYEMLPNIIVGFIVLLLFGFLAYSVSRMVAVYFTRRDRRDLGRIVADSSFWALIIIGTLIALTVITPSLKASNLIASFGVGSLAIGFVFKDILQNWISGLLILLRLPFRRGDQIRVGDAEGTVIRIEPRATIIRTYDGRDIVVPNTDIYSNMVTIHTSQEHRRIEIDFTVGYNYEIRRITKIVQNALSQIEEIKTDPPIQILCWELGSTSLGIKVRWWIDSEKSEEIISRARAIQAIKEAFDANDIDPTDPQLIYYHKVDKQSSIVSGEELDINLPIEPPPEFLMSVNDPETHTPKRDSKRKTLLPEE